MSSHREAPEISKDPVADNTDTYAFVSPDDPETVTLITNYLPAEVPAGGPTFFEFGNDVLYKIHIDNDGDGRADVTYEFTFESTITNPKTFLYNTGTIGSLNDPNWNKRQFYNVTRVDHRGEERRERILGEGLTCPPCNIGPHSTPNYATLGQEAVHSLAGGQATVFAGQRNDPFFVDIGSIFDLADLRPVPGSPSAADAGRVRRGHAADAQRPHDRDPGSDLEPHGRRLGADERDELKGGAGRLGLGIAPQDADQRRRQQRNLGGRSVGAGLAARQPAVQRGADPDGPEGFVEREQTRRRKGFPVLRSASGARETAAGALPESVSRNWKRSKPRKRRAKTSSRSC